MYDYAVLGLGKTGLAVLEFLSRHEPQKKVLASDAGDKPEIKVRALAAHPGCDVELGGHSDRALNSKRVIKSPGLHPALPIFKKLFSAGIPVHSEIEFAQSYFAGRPAAALAVTGTNGKTTATHMSGHILSASGKKTLVAGNIGSPLIPRAESVDSQTHLVLELSSYQLEDSQKLDLDCGVIMNITPDHLDHHGSWEKYVEAKARILSFIRPHGLAVLNFEDPACRKMPKGPWTLLFFSSKRALKEGAWLEGGKIRLRGAGVEGALEPCPNLLGTHNLENQMAAALSCAFAGAVLDQIQGALKNYIPPPHRLERIAENKNILFINDSKATNVDSTLVGLRAIAPLARRRGGMLHLLLGGQDKGFPYKPIADFKEAELRFYAFGQAKDKIISELGGGSFETLKEAASAAYAAARSGDIILLSPACASFDQFSNFEHRGETFRRIVEGLK